MKMNKASKIVELNAWSIRFEKNAHTAGNFACYFGGAVFGFEISAMVSSGKLKVALTIVGIVMLAISLLLIWLQVHYYRLYETSSEQAMTEIKSAIGDYKDEQRNARIS